MADRPEDIERLAALFQKVFNSDELRRFLSKVLAKDLLDGIHLEGPLSRQAFDAAGALSRFRRLDLAFFEMLLRERHYWEDEIRAVAVLFGVDADPQTTITSRALIESLSHIQSKHPASHPIQVFIGAVVAGLLSYVEQGGSHVIELSAHHYRRFVEADDIPAGQRAMAIADLTDETEGFWNEDIDETSNWVEERVFLLDPMQLVDASKLARLIPLFEHQLKSNKVFIGDVNMINWLGDRHHFGPIGVGAHLLLVGSDLVGGYVERENGVFLRLQRDQTLYRRAARRFRELRAGCVEFRTHMSVHDIREAWARVRDVGVWDPAWSRVDDRPPKYFDHYPMNVQAWIPGYERLLRRCADEVGRVLYSQLLAGNSGLAVLEVGFGTGELTRRVASWADTLNRPLARLMAQTPVDALVGIDASRKMVSRCDSTAWQQDFPHLTTTLQHGRWPDDLPAAVLGRDYACICGSLVLHHLLADPTEDQVRDFLQTCTRLLRPGGGVVLSDSFCRADTDDGRRRLEDWNAHMMRFGLRPQTVDDFFRFNPEMKRNAALDTIRGCAEEVGFEPPVLEYLDPPGSPSSAFGVLVLRKRADA